MLGEQLKTTRREAYVLLGCAVAGIVLAAVFKDYSGWSLTPNQEQDIPADISDPSVTTIQIEQQQP